MLQNKKTDIGEIAKMAQITHLLGVGVNRRNRRMDLGD